MKKSTALILVPLIMVFCLTTPRVEAKDGEIHLKSRKWPPVESTDEAETAEIERMRKGVNRVHGLLRLHHIPDQKEKVDLEKSGILLLEYIPENGYLISISGKSEIHKESLAQIQWIGPLAPADKIEPNLREQGIGPMARRPDGRIMLRITYFRDVTAEEAKATLSTIIGITLLKEATDFHYIEIATEENQIMKIAQLDEVQWIEEVPPPAVPHNNGSRVNTGAETVQTAPYNLSGAGVAVGLWDVGNVDSAHDDFGIPSRVTEADNVGVTGNHATHVAGTLGGDGLRSGGTYKGTAPGIKIFSYDFSSGFTPSAHNGAINTYGIDLSNNSWGHDVALTPYNNCNLYGDYSNDAPSFDKIITGLYGKRISIIFSAGNERDDKDCPTLGSFPGYPYYANIPPPATAKNVITVGANNAHHSTITAYCGWGPVDDGRLKPESPAPGDEAGGDGGINSTIPVDTYDVMVGTSMAAPAVSGSAALIIEDYRRIHGVGPLPSTVKALMVHSAQDSGNAGPDFSFGYGKIDVKNAIDLLRSGSVIEDEVGHQASNFFYLEVPADTSSVKVTLVWDDEAAANNAAITLVNDLDLIVRDPTQVQHYPWTLDPNNPSIPAVRIVADHRNNVEQVEVSGILSPGTWTVEVHGFAVPVKAPQKYSLIFTPVSSMLGVSVSPKDAVFASADVPKSILSESPGATSLLTIPSDMIIVGIRVYVDISSLQGFCCFYQITLTSPAGTPVILYDSANNSTAFQTWFDTQTVTVEPLSRFVGENTSGTWSLNVINKLPDNSAIINNWSIEILTRSWAIGTAVAGTTKTMTQANRFVVQNIGNIAETYTLQISDPGSWVAASTVDGNGVDTFVMSGIFSATTDTLIEEAHFNTGSSDDVIPSSLPKSATSTDFANRAVTGQNGIGVPAGDARSLWLQFKAPTESTASGSKRIVVTVGAMPP